MYDVPNKAGSLQGGAFECVREGVWGGPKGGKEAGRDATYLNPKP